MNASPDVETIQLSGYSDIAEEYYDGALHPTCASLRELSERFLVPRIVALSKTYRKLVEVGVGRSILAPAWIDSGGHADSLVLIDSSPKMLAYSAEWHSSGARLALGDASSLPVKHVSVDVLVASLGDPYNCLSFWQETARVVRPGGRVLFTTPSYEWSACFRKPEVRGAAEFLRRDGSILLMPSTVPAEREQAEMFRNANLVLDETEALSVADLRSRPAPKLLCLPRGQPVLRGYVLRRE